MRPLPASRVMNFGALLVTETWDFIKPEMTSTEMVEAFVNYSSEMLDKFFPVKTVTITPYDKPYMTEELKSLCRRRQREYRRSGKSGKYLELKNSFDNKLKTEAEKYRQKILLEVSEGKRVNSYKALRKLEFRHVETSPKFMLPEHAENDLSAVQIAEELAIHFSAISQQFEPLKIENLPPYVKAILQTAETDQTKPRLEEWQVYHRLCSAKKPNSSVPGDLPVKLLKEFLPEVVKPITLIYNRITNSGMYPRQWTVEYQISIPKVTPPSSVDDLRNIASTAFFSKQYEAFIGEWLLPYIEPFLDPGQCGGLKGSSITHYLVKLLHFVHSFLDKREPYAVLLALVDLEKAFNRVSHKIVIEDLADMHVPGWLLLILISYLSERTMFMKYDGASSTCKHLPGSTPQGAFLGILLFLIIFNGALLRPSPRTGSLTLKYVDDLSMLQAIRLKDALKLDTSVRSLPVSYNERTGHKDPMLNDLAELEVFVDRKQLRLKEKKTYMMKFNVSQQLDFPPEITVNGFQNNICVVTETKLLGVILTDDLRWASNTKYICTKAYKKLWVLRRLRVLDVGQEILCDVYQKEVRSVLEVAVPAWHSGLTLAQADQIERVQRVAVKIILGKSCISYAEGLSILGLETLSLRRRKLCLTFAKRTLKSRHSSMFVPKVTVHNTRHQNAFVEPMANTDRFRMSPLNYLTRLLNYS